MKPVGVKLDPSQEGSHSEATLRHAREMLLRQGLLESSIGRSTSSGGTNTKSSRWGWHTWWQPRAKTRSVHVNHQFTAQEKRKLYDFESIDYLAPNTQVYRNWLARQPHRRTWDRWLMMGCIGIAMGCVGFLLYLLINPIATYKYQTTRYIIVHSGLGWALLFNVGCSTLLVALSSFLVVYFSPEAAGSGIPELMAYLNGCLVPKVFNIYTVVVKFLSCGLAVASGLPVGPEGPLIHIGAALGAALSQGHSTTLGISTGLFKRFRNPKDKRDFVTAGVAVGVATAFNAPIGGLLFAFEEVASFWQQSLGWQVFFACMCAVLALNLLRSAGKAITSTGHFGWFDRQVAFEVGVNISSHALAVFPAVVLGAAAGVLAVAFTLFSLWAARLHTRLTARVRWRRVAEACVLTAVYITGCMLLPLLFPCALTDCYTYKGSVYCNAVLQDGVPKGPPMDLPMFTCNVTSGDTGYTWIPDNGTITPELRDKATKFVWYNELATLLFSTGEDGIKHLFSRGKHRWFSYEVLLTLLAWYFVGACLLSGAAISSGLFVPMLMIGATLGRLVGLATTDFAEVLGNTINSIRGEVAEVSNPWTWIDPGAFALVGAGAFMGGVTRLTVALAVIMIEISDDVHMLLPVLVGVLVSKWVADACSRSLYHSMLDAKCVPFLAPEAATRYSLDLIPVSTVMHSPVVVLRPDVTVREVQEVLRDTAHNGFPVVRESPVGPVFVGLITRAHLMVLLHKLLARAPLGAGGTGGEGPKGGRAQPLAGVTYPELNRQTMDPVTAQDLADVEQQMVAMTKHEPKGYSRVNIFEHVVDLMPYVNTSAFPVPVTLSVERTYLLFRTLGLRHLVVVDAHSRVRGMVTRKDLLGFRLDDALAHCDTARDLGEVDWAGSGVEQLRPLTSPSGSAADVMVMHPQPQQGASTV